MYEYGYKDGIIYNNPCNDVILPVESCATPTKIQYSLSDSEMEMLKKTALSKYKTTGEYISRDAIVLLIILNLGLRVGEALALEWDDINVDDRLIYIRKTIQSNIKNFDENAEKATYSRVKQSTKTRSGVRPLQLNDTVLYYFNELKGYDKRHNINTKYVTCTSVGTMVKSRNLQRSLDRIVRKSGIQHNVTLHTLRHTFGSTLVRRGVGIEVVSKLMGHANITITYNKYIHVIKEQEAKAMNMILVC